MIKVCLNCNKRFSNRKSKQIYCCVSCGVIARYKRGEKVGFSKGEYIRRGKKMSKKFKEGRKMTGNPAWKGDEVSISALHGWISKNWGKPRFCTICGSTTEKIYDWSNKNHKYTRNREDWQRLCRGCHFRWDYAYGFRGKKKEEKKKIFTYQA